MKKLIIELEFKLSEKDADKIMTERKLIWDVGSPTCYELCGKKGYFGKAYIRDIN